MPKLDFSTVHCFQMLRSDQFAGLRNYLQATRQETLEQISDIGDEIQLRRLQGRAKLAKELLDLIENSAGLAEKLNPASR